MMDWVYYGDIFGRGVRSMLIVRYEVLCGLHCLFLYRVGKKVVALAPQIVAGLDERSQYEISYYVMPRVAGFIGGLWRG